MPRVGVESSNLTDSSRYGSQNVVTDRVTIPEASPGWITSIGVEASGLDASTPGRVVLYDVAGKLVHQSPVQTWGTALSPRISALATDAVELRTDIVGRELAVGLWGDPTYTRRWREQFAIGENHQRASSSATSPPATIPAWSDYSYPLTAWLDYTPNLAPLAGNWTQVPPSTGAELNPVFRGEIKHPTAEGGRDYTALIHARIFEVGVADPVYDRFIQPTQPEKNQGYFERQFYDHTPGKSYYAEYRQRDTWNIWGDFSARAYYTAGAAPAPPTPTGASGQINTTNPTYSGTYSHPEGSSPAAVQIQLKSGDGFVTLGTSAEIAVASGSTTFSVLHSAISQFPALLEGEAYKWTARFKDALGRFGDYFELVDFRTNAPPFAPLFLSPSLGRRDETGLLSCVVWDPNLDDIQQVKFEVENATTGVLLPAYPRTVTGPIRSLSFAMLNAAADLTLGTLYRWRAQAYDGTLWGAYSSEVEFLYALAPTIKLQGPRFGGLVNVVPSPSAEHNDVAFALTGSDTNVTLTPKRVEGPAYGEWAWEIAKSGANGVSSVRLADALRPTVRSTDTRAFIGVWARVLSGAMSGKLYLDCYNSSDVLISSVSPQTHAAGDSLRDYTALSTIWKPYGMFTDALPAGTVRVRPRVEFSSASAGVAQVDAWSLYLLDDNPPSGARDWYGYFDGDSAAAALRPGAFSWSGTIGASASVGISMLMSANPTTYITYSSGNAKTHDRLVVEQWTGDLGPLGLGSGYAQVYDSGFVAGGTRTAIPYPIGLLKNETAYRQKVHVRDSTSVVRETEWVDFEVHLPGPAEPIVRTVGQDAERGTLTISWERTTLADVAHVATEVAVESAEEGETRFARITNPNVTDATYHYPASGRAYAIKVRFVELRGADEIASRWAGDDVSVEYTRWILKSLEDPENMLTWILWAEDQPTTTPTTNYTSFRPQGRPVPVHYKGEQETRDGTFTVQLPWNLSDTPDQLAKLEELVSIRKVCLLATNPGRKTFCFLADPTETLPDLPMVSAWSVPYEQTYYVEDVFLQEGE